MKRLTALRHAKSSWDNAALGDFDRPLNARGWKAARRMGRELRARGMRFDFALASPAARVRETLDALADGYGEFDFPVRFEKRIYEASVATLLELVRGLPTKSSAALLVGHNLGLERLVVDLTRDSALRDRAAKKFPTAAVAVIDFPVEHWSDVSPGSGSLTELIFPKELD